MERMLLCPSMMCADFQNLSQEIENLDLAGVDIFHCDVMDGSFVPNFTMGLQDIKAIRSHTKSFVDVHLMIENPSKNIDLFIETGVDLIYIHPEAERYTSKTLKYIKNKNVQTGIAINPDTSLSMIEELIEYCDYIMVMTVYPGFAGQKFIDSMHQKLLKLIKLKENYDFKLIIDGACSPEIISKYSKIGVDGFVLGTSALFNKDEPYHSLIENLRKL